MLEPKEKAKELYWKFYQNVSDTSFPEETAKKLALIAVDRELFVLNLLKRQVLKEDVRLIEIHIEYAEQVKTELENL